MRTFDTWVYTSVLGGDGQWRLARGDLPFIGETQLAALTDDSIMLNSRCADGGHGTPPTQTYPVPCHRHSRAVARSTGAVSAQWAPLLRGAAARGRSAASQAPRAPRPGSTEKFLQHFQRNLLQY